MKRNMGVIDRVVRTLLAISVLVLYLTGLITGTAAIILGAIAVIFLLTGIIGLCPLYKLLKINTVKENR